MNYPVCLLADSVTHKEEEEEKRRRKKKRRRKRKRKGWREITLNLHYKLHLSVFLTLTP